MTTRAPLLIDLAGVARLADVRRPVASMWRARFSASADAFPPMVAEKGGRAVFDAIEVARWLERTSHGNNPDAVADSAAAAAPADFDIADATHLGVVDALLALRALSGEPVGASTRAELRARASAFDADDACLLSELSESRPAWAEWADLLSDAAFSPLAASRLLEGRHVAVRAADGSAGAFTAEAEDLFVALAHALAAEGESELVLNAGVAPGLAARMAHVRDDLELGVAPGSERRDIRRRLLCEGITLRPVVSERPAARLFVGRLPAVGARSTSEMLQALDEVALGMQDHDRALVIAPAAALTDAVPSSVAGVRADVLRSGLVRAIVKLPVGLVTSSPREQLAVWVLGREAADLPLADRYTAVADLPLADRYTAVADLSGAALTTAARADMVSDVRAAMGRLQEVRAHSFRFTRMARTSSLIAANGTLVQRPIAARVGEPAPHDLPALLDVARERLGEDAHASSPTVASPPSPIVPAATIGALIAERHLRVRPGTRVEAEELGDSGLVVVGAGDLDDVASIGTKHVDPLAFAAAHPSAQLTLAGDVVFRTAPTPRAWVDPEGSKVVAYPARVLRIDSADPGGLVPELVAADIERASGGAGSWRRWLLRRVSPQARAGLRTALADIAAQRDALARRIEALDAYAELLAAGVASGRVSLADDAADSASETQ